VRRDGGRGIISTLEILGECMFHDNLVVHRRGMRRPSVIHHREEIRDEVEDDLQSIIDRTGFGF
jgi:hypothetical protein